MNSSRNPDFHGIELKSGRSKLLGRQNRAGLFACVPDWKLSSAKGSREILEWFGYRRGADFQLYCEVSCSRANSQGLQLKMNDAEGWLKEICVRPEVQDVCIWRLDELHERLTAKHNETFWLSAKSLRVGAGESFELKSVTHTTEPDPVQFDRLLSDGTITLDHIIKRQPSGGAKERGPQFKIERHRLNELFLGEFQKYSLVE
jgi:hypothetical protein